MCPKVMTKKKRKADGFCILSSLRCRPCPPPLGGDVISPARTVANVLDDMFVGNKEEGVVMAVAESNGTTMTTRMMVCNAVAGKVVDDVPAERGYDGQQ